MVLVAELSWSVGWRLFDLHGQVLHVSLLGRWLIVPGLRPIAESRAVEVPPLLSEVLG